MFGAKALSSGLMVAFLGLGPLGPGDNGCWGKKKDPDPFKKTATSLHTDVVYLPTQVPFSPTAAGKLVTVSVSCPVTASQIGMRVIDPAGNDKILVANSLSNTIARSFSPTSTGIHWAQLGENNWTVAQNSPQYSVSVTQSP
jgi:hypothetical protein